MSEIEKLKAIRDQKLEEYTKAKEISNDAWREYLRADREYEIELYKDSKCDTCRYSAVFDVSPDGAHNLCGCDRAPCTCCNDRCEHYKPDNCITAWIKKSGIGTLHRDLVYYLSRIYSDIMKIEEKDAETSETCMQIIDTIKVIKKYRAEGENSNE